MFLGRAADDVLFHLHVHFVLLVRPTDDVDPILDVLVRLPANDPDIRRNRLNSRHGLESRRKYARARVTKFASVRPIIITLFRPGPRVSERRVHRVDHHLSVHTVRRFSGALQPHARPAVLRVLHQLHAVRSRGTGRVHLRLRSRTARLSERRGVLPFPVPGENVQGDRHDRRQILDGHIGDGRLFVRHRADQFRDIAQKFERPLDGHGPPHRHCSYYSTTPLLICDRAIVS